MKWFRKLAVVMSAAALAAVGPSIAPAQAIVGGADVRRGEFPHMAGLVDKGSGQVFCGGSLISDQYVLTSASCLRGRTPATTAVLLGDVDTATGTDTPYARLYPSGRWTVNPAFDAATDRNDIALIQLGSKAELNQGVSPVLLDTSGPSDHVGQTAEAVGWGTRIFGGPQPTKVQKAALRVISVQQCRNTYGDKLDASSQMCTFAARAGTCQYDTGGPLVIHLNGRLHLVGLISYGQGCAGGYPDVYTRVAAYRHWIEQIVGSLPAG
ncbi:serine protease [Streptomyces sp. NBC_01267]|uniref:serine protease n=1 Tax=Streptomyces sp. NBC_01267 TaxID=2903805 RepID=UPI002E358093|nr:serine protease [Streptomyces sp. NBC_01267]